MMKSYQESGGTSLSTNWSEVGKGKMETKAPEGMEARKW
jgi:suppressor of G2 allele of SKP1